MLATLSNRHVMPSSWNVLVVDDNDEVRRLLCDIITSMGGTTHEASDGTSAIQIANVLQPELILLDVEMPGIDGFQTCKALKQNTNTFRIPVVIITSLSDLDDKVKGIESGADDFLTKPVRVQELRARVRSLVKMKRLYDSLESAENVIFSLALAIEAKDAYTQGHTERVTEYAVRLGTACGLSQDDLTSLRQGGALHDIGKIGVPDHILNKPGKLTDEEFDIVRKHPLLGHDICAPMKALARALPCIRWHHERPNGKGYPDRLKSPEIPQLALIMAIADVYDALTTKRSYKSAFAPAQAIEILRSDAAAGALDAPLVEVFVSTLAP